MAEQTHTPESVKGAQNRGRGAQEGNGSASSGEESRRSGEQGAAAANQAAQTNADLMQKNIETTQRAINLGAEATARTFERFAQTMTEVFSLEGASNKEGSRTVAENLEAASRAGTGLALLAQEAARAWLDLTRQTIKTNLEAAQELASCRSIQDAASIQTKLVRQNLESAVQAGQAISDASRRNLEGITQTLAREAGRQPAA